MRQAVCTISIGYLLTACHRYDVVPKDIEYIPKNTTMHYIAKSRYQRALSRLDGAIVYMGPSIKSEKLSIELSGRVRSTVHNAYFSFVPRAFLLSPNHCKVLLLMDKEHQSATPLQVCFVNNVLLIDPDPLNTEQAYQSSILYPSSLWLIGAPLKGITTYGVAGLKDAQFSVRLVRDSP